MHQRHLPKYFLNRAGEPGQVRQPQVPAHIAHIVDCFRLSNSYTEAQDWIVATDSFGNLQALADGARSHLPAQAQSELAWFEMAGHGKRQIEASEIILFYLQMMEQLPEAPGLNDPIYLYGTLFGPYPSASPVSGVEGQLTITRADLLEGLLLGAEFAFRFAGNGDNGPRCFHLTLPADGEDAIRHGRGVVIAYPLLPPELILADVTNELFTCRLIHDTLTALKEDAMDEKISHPINNIALPVPSRALLEQQLESEGYEIKDDKAVRKPNPDDQRGFLTNALGALLRESMKLPPEGSPEDFIELARLTLRALPRWPTARAVALRNLIKHAPTGSANRVVNTQSVSPPPVYPRPQTPRNLSARPPDRPPGWVQDFIATHHSSNTTQSHLTSSVDSSDWMKDFADDSVHSMNQNETNASNKSPLNPINKRRRSDAPDWMEDFD
ncbi:MAG: hypothetical protein ACKVZH_19795 [Blastocatellia bacterium]